MNATKRAVVRRLWALADGAEPARCSGIVAYGLCTDMAWFIPGPCNANMEAYGIVGDALKDLGLYGFPENDWGNERRTLAGFLACWLEDSK